MEDRKLIPFHTYLPKRISILNVNKLYEALHFSGVQTQNKTIIMNTD